MVRRLTPQAAASCSWDQWRSVRNFLTSPALILIRGSSFAHPGPGNDSEKSRDRLRQTHDGSTTAGGVSVRKACPRLASGAVHDGQHRGGLVETLLILCVHLRIRDDAAAGPRV